MIDQVAISNDNLWASTTNRSGYGRLSEGGFSDESVEDALALRKSLSNVLKLGEEAGLQHRGCVAMNPQQHAEALAEICFHFCSVESFEMFAHEQQEAVELLLQTLLPIYAQRVSAVRDELDTLADYLDESGFEEMLAAYLEHNGFSEFEFDPDSKYGFYGHVDQHLKLAGELSIIVIAKTLSDANYLCGNASQKIPYLDQVAGIRDRDQYQAALESIALKAIPWLIQPAVQPFDEPKTEQKCGVKRQSESPEPGSNKQPRVALTDDDMSDALL